MPSPYKRHPRLPLPADFFKLLSRLVEEEGIDLDQTLEAGDARSLFGSLLETARVPIRLYGTRAEEMFAYVVAALGAASAIKREETDDLIVPSAQQLTVPDFRVMLPDRGDILVEVKSINEKDPSRSRAPKLNYLRKLAEYGRLFDRPVYLAAYWAPWRNWTLHPVDELISALEKGPIAFSFGQAYRRSHMRLLGDALIATEFPLTLRMDVKSKVLKKRGSRSQQLVTIDSAGLYVAEKFIRSKRDERIAFGFMLYGQWEESERLTMDGDAVTRIEYVFSPINHDASEPIATVASLSGLASAEFNQLTADHGRVTRLRPGKLPSPPYPKVKEKYFGEDLPLWIFILKASGKWHTSADTTQIPPD